MNTYDDDNIEFDFFDEPETVEATQRRRLPRLEMPGGGRGGGERPPRPPMQTPTGLVPLARLVGLIAIAIAIVVGLVFWAGSCQGKSKQGEYKSYVEKVRAIATADTSLGKKFANEFASPGLKESDLVAKLQDYAQQEQQAYQQAQQMLVDDAPVAFLAQSVSWHLVRTYVRGAATSPLDEWPGALDPAAISIAPH